MTANIPTLRQDLQQNYFALLGLAPAYDLDGADVAKCYYALQKTVHPDRFAHDSAQAQRMAAQQAAFVNAAYETLRSPLKRALYLLELAGVAQTPETTTHDTAFLMQQMQLRERLEDGTKNLPALDALFAEVQAGIDTQMREFAQAWQTQNWPIASSAVNKLQFMSKLAQEIDDKQARLLD
jgi:molecular chaperone HscB